MSLVMVEQGHLTLAKAVANETFYLAWGGIPVGIPTVFATIDWGTNGSSVYLKTAVDDVAARGVILTVYFQTAAGVYVAEKITLNATDSSIPVHGTKACKIPMAVSTPSAIASLRVMNAAEDVSATIAMPTVDLYGEIASWLVQDIPPLIDMDIDQLFMEHGRRLYSAQAYAFEDAVNGTIDANNTKWSLTAAPTRHLYLQFKFDSNDSPAAIVYQLAVFMNSVMLPNLPIGQKYFVPGEVADPGSIFMAENVQPIARNNATREMFEYIITF